MIAGASAILDRRDVIPAAIVAAGGAIDHFGMPVDPGNLLLMGRVGSVPVLGLPGCARSPRVNGFDWVLRRLLASLPVDAAVLARMGVGGLLSEIPTRPHPRAGTAEDGPVPTAPRLPRIAALVLAAGRSSRMGTINKLLIGIDGQPMVRHAVAAVHSPRRLRAQAGRRRHRPSTRAEFEKALADTRRHLRPQPRLCRRLGDRSLKAGIARFARR